TSQDCLPLHAGTAMGHRCPPVTPAPSSYQQYRSACQYSLVDQPSRLSSSDPSPRRRGSERPLAYALRGVGLERDLVQRRDDFPPEQFDGTHDVLVGHRPFITINVQVAGVQVLDDLRQFFNDSAWTADDDVVHGSQFIIAHLAPKRAGADGR